MEKTQQQVDIVAHLEKLLFEHETVIIPTFGGFTATRSAAAVDMVGGLVAPPSKSLAFNENLTVDDGILVHEIATTYGLENDDARQVIIDFVTQTKDALSNRDIVTFNGIGRLYKNYAQKIQFLPDTANFNTDSFGLPPLQFSPVARGSENGTPPPVATPAPTASNPIPSFTPPQPAQTEVQKPAPAVTRSLSSAETPPAPAPIQRSVQSGSPMRSMSVFLVGLLVFAVAVGIYLAKRKSAAAGLTNATPTEQPSTSALPTPGTIMDEAQKRAENEIANTKPTAPAADSDNDKDVADEAEEVTAKKLEAAAAEKSKAKNDKSAAKNEIADEGGDKRCVLIIGTFQDKNNVNKLIAKLKKNGYDTYHRFVKGHQVGVEFNYDNLTEVQAKIEDLQNLTGQKDIWIKKR